MSAVAKSEWDLTHHPSGAPFGKLYSTQAKEQFSIAYAHAVVTAARCTISDPRVDDERVDFSVRQKADHGKYSRATIDVQMKCTEQNVMYDDGVHWQLERDHYNDLISTNLYHDVILVVMTVPQAPSAWLHHLEPDKAHSGLVLHDAAYWVSLRGLPPTDNGKKTVVLPKENVFDVPQLLAMLQRVGDGGHV